MARLTYSDRLGQVSDKVIRPDGHGHPLKGVVRDVRGDGMIALSFIILILQVRLDGLKSGVRRHG